MDHRYIEEHNIVSRHVMGKLSARETAEFEEHFLDCPQCLDELQTSEDFRRALKQVAAEDTLRSRYTVPGGFAGWLAKWRTWQQVAIFAAAGLFVAALSLGSYLAYRGRGEQERQNTIAAEREWRRRYETERHAAAAAEKRLQQVERKLEERERAAGNESRTPANLPPVASVFTLSMSRSVDLGRESEPVNRFALASLHHWIVFSMDLPNASEFRDYQVTVADTAGRVIWSNTRLVPTTPEALAVTVHSSLFSAGNYSLRLQGRTRDGRYVPVGKYFFRLEITR